MLTQLNSSDDKGVKNTNKGACIKIAGIGSISTKDTYVSRDTSAKDAFFAVDACVKSVFVGGAYAKSIYIEDVSAFEHWNAVDVILAKV